MHKEIKRVVIFLKESIDSILAIDQKTRELVDNIEKSKALGKEKSDEILADFEKKADNLRKDNERNLKEIEEFYNENSDKFIKSAFDMVIGRKSNV